MGTKKFQSSSAISKGLGNALGTIADISGLPPIRGTWFFVDPKNGSDAADGRSIGSPVKNIRAAYDKCTTSVGDGIALLAYPSTTSSDTTTYLGGQLVWAKHGITVYGVAAPNVFNGRARIAAKDRAHAYTTGGSWTTSVITDTDATFVTDGWEVGDAVLVTCNAGTAITSLNVVSALTETTLTLTDAVTANSTTTAGTISTHSRPMITVSGRHNAFYNISFYNGGTVATDDGAVYVTGTGNYFENCFFQGVGNTTVGAEDTCYDLAVVTSECRFKGCMFGNNSTIRASTSAHIVLGNSTTQIGQNFFEDCRVISYSATAGHMAISIANAATLGGWIQFKNCEFVNWNPGAVTTHTAVIGGSDPSNLGILLKDCTQIGWTIWADTGWDCVYTHNPVGAGTAGIALISG